MTFCETCCKRWATGNKAGTSADDMYHSKVSTDESWSVTQCITFWQPFHKNVYIYIYIMLYPCKLYDNIYTQMPCVYSQSSWETFLFGMNSLLCSMWYTCIFQLVPIRFWRWVMVEWLGRWTQQWAAEGVFDILRPAFETALQREAIRS